MVKVIHLADDGTEKAAVEVDDFTIEVIYSGIAEMLREARGDAAARSLAAARAATLPRARRASRRRDGSSAASAPDPARRGPDRGRKGAPLR